MSKEALVQQVVDAAKESVVPVSVTGITLFGIALPDIIHIMTGIYIVIQVAYIVTKWRKGK